MEIPDFVPPLQRKFLEQIVGRLRDDSRVLGIAAGGSMIAGPMDEYSDIDLVVVVSEDSLPTDLSAKLQIAQSLGPLLTGFTGTHVGEQRLLICLYSAPLIKVDLKFIVLGDLARRVEDPVILYDPTEAIAKAMADTDSAYPMPNRQWIEDAFWVWIHYSAAKIRRGELLEAISILNFLVEKVLGPLALLESGHRPSGVRRLETLAPNRLAAISSLCVPYDRESIKAGFQSAASLYKSLRSDVELRLDAENAALIYLFDS